MQSLKRLGPGILLADRGVALALDEKIQASELVIENTVISSELDLLASRFDGAMVFEPKTVPSAEALRCLTEAAVPFAQKNCAPADFDINTKASCDRACFTAAYSVELTKDAKSGHDIDVGKSKMPFLHLDRSKEWLETRFVNLYMRYLPADGAFSVQLEIEGPRGICNRGANPAWSATRLSKRGELLPTRYQDL